MTSKLREALKYLRIVEPMGSLESSGGMYLGQYIVELQDKQVDAIIDAVIEALPKQESYFYYNRAIDDVKSILLEAKENK